jgi:hypothetical protein
VRLCPRDRFSLYPTCFSEPANQLRRVSADPKYNGKVRAAPLYFVRHLIPLDAPDDATCCPPLLVPFLAASFPGGVSYMRAA